MKKKLLFLIVPILIIMIGVSFAFFTYQGIGDNSSEVITGQLYLKYADTNTLTLSNIFPETKTTALAREDNVISFTVKGKNTHTTDDVAYSIGITYGDEISGKTRINPADIRVYLESDGNILVDGVTYEEWNNQKIYESVVKANTTEETTTNYTLRVWVNENVLISDSNESADYTADVWNNSYISLKVVVEGKDIYVPTLKEAVEADLADYLTEPDEDGTRFLNGSDVENNYVWYSGKLWRIVSINGDGSIKLVTQGNMTTVAWNTTDSTDYSNSQIRSWLNNEFLPTLYDADNLLVDAIWDYTTYESFPTTKLTTTASVTEKVGLLNVYEFMMTGGTDDESTTSTFLTSGYAWSTITPVDDTYVWYVRYDGISTDYSLVSTYSADTVRPSINILSDIRILDGTGEKTNPYMLEGDKAKGTNSELLINRISGEYINFNDTLYRIVGIEEINDQELTKITMADYSVNSNTLTTSLAFGASTSEITYSPTYGIGLYLEEWYQADSTSETYASNYISDTYKTMISTKDDGIVWYSGPDNGARFNYTLSKTGTAVSATIGLPYYGEMFSSQFGDGYDKSTELWLITSSDRGTSYGSLYGLSQVSSAFQGAPTSSYGVRPSFYLKSDVKIVSGSGMPNDPYEITQ